MPAVRNSASVAHTSIASLCSASEKRFLFDLIEQEGPGSLDDHPVPELYALLRAIERMWGGESAKQLTAPPELVYYLAVCAAYLHHISEDVEEWRAGAAHEVYHILQGFMETVAVTTKDGALVKYKDDGEYIDLFSILRYLYNEVVNRQQLFNGNQR